MINHGSFRRSASRTTMNRGNFYQKLFDEDTCFHSRLFGRATRGSIAR